MDIFTFTKPFILGGISGMTATSIIQPIDVIKTTMQLRKKTTILQTVSTTWTRHGIFGFYSGLSAAILRQGIYTYFTNWIIFPFFV